VRNIIYLEYEINLKTIRLFRFARNETQIS